VQVHSSVRFDRVLPSPSACPHTTLWRVPARVQKYQGLQGWIDDGERLVVNSIADEVRARGILDLGVGAGRTTWFLRLLTTDYVAIDWSPEMVAACRLLYAGIDARQGDASDLSAFPDARFKLVFFSYNGIDNLGRADRLRVLDEAWRVLEPDGLFVYSTLSKLGPAYMERPVLATRRDGAEPVMKFAGRWCYRLLTTVDQYPRRARRWRHAKASARDHGDWAIAPLSALDFEMAYFTTVPGERKMLADHGFQVVQLISDDGRSLHDDAHGCSWFHVVARKVTAGSPPVHDGSGVGSSLA